MPFEPQVQTLLLPNLMKQSRGNDSAVNQNGGQPSTADGGLSTVGATNTTGFASAYTNGAPGGPNTTFNNSFNNNNSFSAAAAAAAASGPLVAAPFNGAPLNSMPASATLAGGWPGTTAGLANGRGASGLPPPPKPSANGRNTLMLLPGTTAANPDGHPTMPPPNPSAPQPTASGPLAPSAAAPSSVDNILAYLGYGTKPTAPQANGAMPPTSGGAAQSSSSAQLPNGAAAKSHFTAAASNGAAPGHAAAPAATGQALVSQNSGPMAARNLSPGAGTSAAAGTGAPKSPPPVKSFFELPVPAPAPVKASAGTAAAAGAGAGANAYAASGGATSAVGGAAGAGNAAVLVGSGQSRMDVIAALQKELAVINQVSLRYNSFETVLPRKC